MTTTERPERSVPKPVFTDAEAGAKEFPDSTDHVGVHQMYAFRYDPAAGKATLFASDLPIAAG